MRPSYRKNIFVLFWIIVLADIAGIIFHIPLLHIVAKPLLMPALIAAILLQDHKAIGWKKIIIALLFSLLGDIFLLFPDTNPQFFILGVASFLITHIFYIIYFIGLKGTGASVIKKYPYLIALIILYSGSLLYLLMPGLGDLKIPVIIYACTISVMLYCSLRLPADINTRTKYMFIAGAASFVLSDSLLAIDKFYRAFPLAAVLIMLSYCIAQYLIVKGFIRIRH